MSLSVSLFAHYLEELFFLLLHSSLLSLSSVSLSLCLCVCVCFLKAGVEEVGSECRERERDRGKGEEEVTPIGNIEFFLEINKLKKNKRCPIFSSCLSFSPLVCCQGEDEEARKRSGPNHKKYIPPTLALSVPLTPPL